MPFKDPIVEEYLQLGFSVIPIIKETKLPHIPWVPYQAKLPDAGDIRIWRSFWPEANIGIITGKISNVVVLDVDGPAGEASVAGRHLPPTWVSKTGKGWHYWFRPPAGTVVTTRVGLLNHVDLKGEGGYVVAPNSVHKNGKAYEWIHRDGLEIAEIPVWLHEAHLQTQPSENSPDWLTKALAGVPEGERNNTCAKLAGYYIGCGNKENLVLEALCNWNRRNTVPLNEKEIVAIVSSIAQRDRNALSAIRGTSPQPLTKCKEVIQKWLYFEDNTMVDTALAAVAMTHYNGDPLWIVFVGPGSCGKTEVLRALDRHKDTRFIDKLTPATFASGLPKAKGILESMDNPNKTFILQDFACILSKPPYDRAQIIDTLRQMYNGQWCSDWGSGKKPFVWRGRVNLLSGCTPDIESASRSIAELGERFLYFRVASDSDYTRQQMQVKARVMEGHEKEAREEIAEAMHGAIAWALANGKPDEIVIPSEIGDWLDALADISTMFRSVVKRNAYDKDMIEYTPHLEGPSRMFKACCVLLKGLALMDGRKEVTQSDYVVAVKICIDSIPSMRREVLRVMVREYGHGGVTAKYAAGRTGYLSTKCVGYTLADLASLGVLERYIPDNADLNDPANVSRSWNYNLKENIFQRMEKCGLLTIV